MHVLIITPTDAEFQATVAGYHIQWDRENEYHHVTTKEQMQGYRMPVQIRFVGNWWEMPDAPTLEFYAQHIISSPPKTE
jgi:hypothetical protein